jgi:hypothetical protein
MMRWWLDDDLLGTLTLDAATGYIVEEYDLGFPDAQVVATQRTYADGTIDDTAFHGARSVTLLLHLDPRIAPWTTLRDRLAGYLHPARRPYLYLVEPGAGGPRRILVRGDRTGIAVNHPRHNKMQATWVGVDGTIEAADESSITLGSDQVGSETGRVYPTSYPRVYGSPTTLGPFWAANSGSAPAWWQATVYGECTDPVITIGDSTIVLAGLAVDAGHSVTIDCRTRRVYADFAPATSYAGLVDFASSVWAPIPPGGAGATFSAANLGATASCRVTWRETWL